MKRKMRVYKGNGFTMNIKIIAFRKKKLQKKFCDTKCFPYYMQQTWGYVMIRFRR